MENRGQIVLIRNDIRKPDNHLLCVKKCGGLYMSAYLIVDTKISNLEAYEEYKKLAKPII